MTNGNLRLLFPTPLWEARIGDKALNAKLKEAVYSVEKSDTTFDRKKYPFGYTSYHSGMRLDADVRFREITLRVLQEAKKFLVAMQMKKELDHSILSLRVHDLFCNINRKYSSHGPHRHEYVDLSAVYYVDVDTDSSEFIAHNPIEPLLMHTRPHFFADTSPMAQEKWEFRPENGKLLLFPSWMMHEVAQQRTDHERISLAFNLGFMERPKDKAAETKMLAETKDKAIEKAQ